MKFISIYTEIFGKEVVVELDDNATARDLIEYISKMIEKTGIKIMPIVFINYKFTSESQILNDGDEALVMPPFAGG